MWYLPTVITTRDPTKDCRRGYTDETETSLREKLTMRYLATVVTMRDPTKDCMREHKKCKLKR